MRNILTILIFSLFIFGCNNDGGLFSSSIELLSPTNSIIEPCDITFEWNGKQIKGDCILEIATNENFENIVITEIVEGESYTLKTNLQPRQKYFWRISGDGITESASFEIEDKLTDFIGRFTVIGDFKTNQSGTTDRRWTTTVEIKIDENGYPTLIDLNENITIDLAQFMSVTHCPLFRYEEEYDVNEHTTITETCKLNTDRRTFEFTMNNNWRGLNRYYKYTGSID